MAGRGAAVLPANGAFRYGYGLFETMLVQQAEIRLGAYHWERLFSGIARLRLKLPDNIDAGYLEQEVLRTVRRNNAEKLCRVRLQVFAGDGGLFEPGIANAGYLIECFEIMPGSTGFNENGLVCGVAEGLAKSADELANIKTCSGLVYAMAARQANENKWNDALIRNCSGKIIESTIANLFWIKNGTIYTPPLSDGCIAGVMRRFIQDQLPVKEKSVEREELGQADEIFLTNAIRGMKWVRAIDNDSYNNIESKHIYYLLFLKKSLK